MTVFRGFDEAVVVDVETTGLDPKSDRVVSVAMIRANFASLNQGPSELCGDTIEAVVNPQVSIPRDAARVHGITDRDVVGKGFFVENAQPLRDFIGDLPIIAHNVSFDKAFLSAEFKRAKVKTLARNKSYCTMLRFQELNGGHRKGSNLDNVAAVMGVAGRRGKIHDAMQDAKITCEIAGWFYMLDNGIEFPCGKSMSRTLRAGHCEGISDAERTGTALGGCLVIGMIVMIGLFLWWLFG